MKKNIISVVIIITLLMLIPLAISIKTDDPPENVTINIPDAVIASQILIEFVNTGAEIITDIAVMGEFQPIFGIVILGDMYTGSIPSISPGETITLKIPMQFGIGLIKYIASASWGDQTVETERNYILIGFLIFTL